MKDFEKYTSWHAQVNYSEDTNIAANCHAIEFYNQGDTSVLIKIGQGFKRLEQGQSVSYENTNIEVKIVTDFDIEFETEGTIKDIVVTQEHLQLIKNNC